MPIETTVEQLRLLRVRGQRLDAEPEPADAPSIARAVCGLQAQESAAAALAARARGCSSTAREIEMERVERRSLVRTWLMRGTLHLVAVGDLRPWLSLFGPLALRRGRRRRLELGLDDERTDSALEVLIDALANAGPLTRIELAAKLAARNIVLVGQALPHLIGYAAFHGLVCMGPDRGAKTTTVLLADWVDTEPAPPRDVVLVNLARRYIAAYGPAAPGDFATWSGLASADVSDAWAAIEDELTELAVDGRSLWVLTAAGVLDGPPRNKSLRLLPRFDPYLLGYRQRDLAVESRHSRAVHPGGGIIHQTLMIDGRVAGTWRSLARGGTLAVSVEPFEPLSAELEGTCRAEVADLGRFFGLPSYQRGDS